MYLNPIKFTYIGHELKSQSLLYKGVAVWCTSRHFHEDERLGRFLATATEIDKNKTYQNTSLILKLYKGKVKSSRPSLYKIRDKRPLGRDPDRSWCHRHTSVKFFWSQPMAPWTRAEAYSYMMSMEPWAATEKALC